MSQHLYAQSTNVNMKNTASKNNQNTVNKFEKLIFSAANKKNIKGGSDPIIWEDSITS